MTPSTSTPTITAATPAATVSSAPTKLSTYEECAGVVEAALKIGEITGKDEALHKLHTFFKDRIARRASNEERDSGFQVKKAMSLSRRPFMREVAKPDAPDKAIGPTAS